jgi:hypothetical protein
MTTLSVYCGWTKVEVEDIDEPRYMGGFRVIYPNVFDEVVACNQVLFSTSDEAIEFATTQCRAFLELLEVFGVIEPQIDVAWEDISPPN